MITKIKTLELVLTMLELANYIVDSGGHVHGMTDQQVRDWTFQPCPDCKVWHDNPHSKFCSYWCADGYHNRGSTHGQRVS